MKKLYKIQILVNINKILLEHGHVYSFVYFLWLLTPLVAVRYYSFMWIFNCMGGQHL